jgi:hypothetical protein
MFEKYNSDKLYIATIRNLYLNKELNKKGKSSYFKSRRKGILYDDGNTMIDISRPDEDINDMSYTHQVQIFDVEPLYPEGVHKVVSKRQAYKQYRIKKRKLTNK